MARDDYFVIVYQVLKYLYDCLKKGEKPNPDRLNDKYFSIHPNYWLFILVTMDKEGYIDGLNPHAVKTVEGVSINGVENAMITPRGIEYLFENSLLQKVKRTLTDISDIIP